MTSRDTGRWAMAALLGAGILISRASAETPAAGTVTIRGEVVDPASYLKEGKRGAELTDQTYEAVDGGQTLALVEDGTGTLYLFLTEQAGEDPNELAYDYVNRQITASGRVYERGGMRGLVATSVVPVEPPPTAAQPSSAPAAPVAAPATPPATPPVSN